ncbi:MAG: CHAT domain-containing protein, partial [bacterium]|nr:CHAT domain-containing protein [bacterium]
GSAHGLPCACEEAEEIRRLAEELGVESQVLPQITAAELEDLLRRGGVDWLHVISHGKFDAAAPEESRLVLCDGRNLRPGDLHGRIRTQIRRDRPLVFLNACQSGQQGFSLTGLGGWAAAWVADCRCAAFIGPQWAVRDDLARTFATVLYRQLARGATLGRATLAARLATRDQEPG